MEETRRRNKKSTNEKEKMKNDECSTEGRRNTKESRDAKIRGRRKNEGAEANSKRGESKSNTWYLINNDNVNVETSTSAFENGNVEAFMKF